MHTTTGQSGFTLIEMLVSLSLFTIIMTITVGSLLVLISGNRELVNSQSVMDTLAFSLDSMTREIRTGRAYFCGSVDNQNAAIPSSGGLHIFREGASGPPSRNEAIGDTVRDCPGGNTGDRNFHGVSIIEGGDSVTGPGSSRILYYYVKGSGSTPGKLMRRVGDDPAERILPSNINVIDADFFVTGTERLTEGTSDNIEQPTVTVLIVAADINNPAASTTLQTTVTQRELDI